MRLNKYILTIVATFASMQLFAQGFYFPTSKWDFGKIKEQSGVVCHTFKAVNKGSSPLVITKVYTSCGCTTTDYPTRPIAIGDTLQIKVCFDPAGRPGEFDKDVNIAVNGQFRNTITISGEVEAKPHTIEDDYPFYMVGGLRFDQNTFGFRQMGQGTVSSMVVRYVNTSNNRIRPKFVFVKKSGFLKITYPEYIEAGAKGDITLTYDLSKTQNAYGIHTDKIVVIVGEKQSDMSLYTSVIGVDDFRNTSLDTAPKLKLSTQFYNFGEIPQRDEPYKHTIVATNEGDEPLIVRSVGTRTTGVSTTLHTGTVIAPHDTIKFDLILDSRRYYMPDVFDYIPIVVNDPSRPFRELKVGAKLKLN